MSPGGGVYLLALPRVRPVKHGHVPACPVNAEARARPRQLVHEGPGHGLVLEREPVCGHVNCIQFEAEDTFGQACAGVQFRAAAVSRAERSVPADSKMAQGDAFNRREVSSVYVGPDHRFVVSLIVGVKDAQDVRSAASAVLGLTKYPHRGETVWSVHDRHTGLTTELRQADFEVEDVEYVKDDGS